jgi:hypothetical protein
VKTDWLRYGRRRTGFVLRFHGERLSVGLRWSRRVFNAPAGPFLLYPSTSLQLDPNTISREAKENIALASLAIFCIGAIWVIGWLG